jgi:hypothetical protein
MCHEKELPRIEWWRDLRLTPHPERQWGRRPAPRPRVAVRPDRERRLVRVSCSLYVRELSVAVLGHVPLQHDRERVPDVDCLRCVDGLDQHLVNTLVRPARLVGTRRQRTASQESHESARNEPERVSTRTGYPRSLGACVRDILDAVSAFGRSATVGHATAPAIRPSVIHQQRGLVLLRVLVDPPLCDTVAPYSRSPDDVISRPSLHPVCVACHYHKVVT